MERALIVRQPWIEKILSGEKTWEMRSKRTLVRGRIGLIEQGTGLIVGECDLIHSGMPLDKLDAECFHCFHRVDDLSLIENLGTFTDKEWNVLFLFDGMSCGQIALNRIGIKPAKYYAAETERGTQCRNACRVAAHLHGRNNQR